MNRLVESEPREWLLRSASLVAALAVLTEWTFGALTGANVGRSTLTLLGAVAVVALAWRGSSYGRFGGMGFTFALFVLGVMRFVVDDYYKAPLRHRIFGVLDLVFLGVAFVGFTLGVERTKVAAGSSVDRSLRALFGAIIGVIVALMGSRPALVFCAARNSQLWQAPTTCNGMPRCALMRGCEVVPGHCVCEREGECSSACAVKDDRVECLSFRECRWEDCQGVPEPCSSYAFDECPFDIDCERVGR